MPLVNLGVYRIQATGMHAYEHVVRPRRRQRLLRHGKMIATRIVASAFIICAFMQSPDRQF